MTMGVNVLGGIYNMGGIQDWAGRRITYASSMCLFWGLTFKIHSTQ